MFTLHCSASTTIFLQSTGIRSLSFDLWLCMMVKSQMAANSAVGGGIIELYTRACRKDDGQCKEGK